MYCDTTCAEHPENRPDPEECARDGLCSNCGGAGATSCPDCAFECGSGLDERTNDYCESCGGNCQRFCDPCGGTGDAQQEATG